MTPTDQHSFRRTFAAVEIDGLEVPSKGICEIERALDRFLASRGLRKSWRDRAREKKVKQDSWVLKHSPQKIRNKFRGRIRARDSNWLGSVAFKFGYCERVAVVRGYVAPFTRFVSYRRVVLLVICQRNDTL